VNSIITYLLWYIQYLEKTISELLIFIAKFIPLKQFVFDDANSPNYQKFKTDKLPVIKKHEKQDYSFLLEYYLWKYGKAIKPISRRNGKDIPDSVKCPVCGAPHQYIYDNTGGRGSFKCKICGCIFASGEKDRKSLVLSCPYCGNVLQPKKDRKHFTVHKCINKHCSYYLANLKKLPSDLPKSERYEYKLHYIYREFNFDFFKVDLNTIPDRAFSFVFRKKSAHIMGLCLAYHVNLGLSLRKTALALHDIHNVNISHTMVANYAKTAAAVIKPLVDNYDYKPSDTLIADETYIKVRGRKGYVWLIMDAVSRSILGYRVSDNRGVGACILAMRMAFRNITSITKKFRFIADGYSAYPLAAQQFALRQENPLQFDITQVIGLTNDDAVSKEFRPFKQIVERLNRTFKASYRLTCGYDTFDGANYSVSLWVAYYNFLRPHPVSGRFMPLNKIDSLDGADTMQTKWQLLIFLGQQTILHMQKTG
jgi:transposase-like protein/DNA-directed RNA polymerase subunit RPC12/RpoP